MMINYSEATMTYRFSVGLAAKPPTSTTYSQYHSVPFKDKGDPKTLQFPSAESSWGQRCNFKPANNPNTISVLAPGSPWMPKPTYCDIVGEFRGRYTSQKRGNVHEKNWKLFLLGTWTLKIATKQEFELLKILYMCNSNLTLIGNMNEIQLRKWWFLKTPTKPKFFMCDIGADEIMVILCGHFSNHCYIRFVLSKSFPKSLTDVKLHKTNLATLVQETGDLPSQWLSYLELDRTIKELLEKRSSLRILGMSWGFKTTSF